MLDLADEGIRQPEARAYPAWYEMNEQSRSLPLSCNEFHEHITNSYTVVQDVHTEQTVRLSECLSTARRV